MRKALVGLAVLLAGAFGSMTGAAPVDAATPPASTTPKPTPPVFTDAPSVRDQLLAIGLANLNEQERPQFFGFFDAWRVPYPGLVGRGSAIVATGDGVVSASRNLLDPKGGDSPSNPTVIAFAVADKSGRCAGAVIYGYPKTDKSMKIGPAECNAQGVVAAFKLVFQATPPPNTTVPASTTVASPSVVPAPPNTGSGMTAGNPSQYGVLVSAVLVLVVGVGLTVVSRRN